MHEIYSRVFNKWMNFGGVTSGPRQFTGKIRKQDLEDKDAEDIVRMMATHHVDWDRNDTNKWHVDFERLAKGFFTTSSSYYPSYFTYTTASVKRSTQVMRSFYNYLLSHSVCPEYRSDILAARSICDQADIELPAIRAAGLALPGSFNIAVSTIVGGYYAGQSDGHPSWDDTDYSVNWPGEMAARVGMKTEEAHVVFKMGVVVYGTDEQYELVQEQGIQSIKKVREEEVGLCVTSIELASPDVLAIYAEQNKSWKHKLTLTPLGKLRCEEWKVPSFDTWDLPHDVPKKPKYSTYEFWVDDEFLAECFVGMKLEAKVMELNCGLWVLDSVMNVHCSFYTKLVNELVVDSKWKEVRYLKSKETQTMEAQEAEEEEEGSS